MAELSFPRIVQVCSHLITDHEFPLTLIKEAILVDVYTRRNEFSLFSRGCPKLAEGARRILESRGSRIDTFQFNGNKYVITVKIISIVWLTEASRLAVGGN
jgi:hypothetical protein